MRENRLDRVLVRPRLAEPGLTVLRMQEQQRSPALVPAEARIPRLAVQSAAELEHRCANDPHVSCSGAGIRPRRAPLCRPRPWVLRDPPAGIPPSCTT